MFLCVFAIKAICKHVVFWCFLLPSEPDFDDSSVSRLGRQYICFPQDHCPEFKCLLKMLKIVC